MPPCEVLVPCRIQNWPGYVEEHTEHFDGARVSEVDRLGGSLRAVDEDCVGVCGAGSGGWAGPENR